MQLIKARFLRDGEPHGRTYTYQSSIDVEVGDVVQLNKKGIGAVIEINVPELEAEAFKDKLKTIIGKIETKEVKEFDESEAVDNE